MDERHLLGAEVIIELVGVVVLPFNGEIFCLLRKDVKKGLNQLYNLLFKPLFPCLEEVTLRRVAFG